MHFPATNASYGLPTVAKLRAAFTFFPNFSSRHYAFNVAPGIEFLVVNVLLCKEMSCCQIICLEATLKSKDSFKNVCLSSAEDKRAL